MAIRVRNTGNILRHVSGKFQLGLLASRRQAQLLTGCNLDEPIAHKGVLLLIEREGIGAIFL